MGDEKKYDLKKVKEIIDIMVENDLVEVEIVDGDSKIHLKRPGSSVVQVPAAVPLPIIAPQAANAAYPLLHLIRALHRHRRPLTINLSILNLQ